ncbi:MAG: type II secretion system F family protein [Sedimenticola sp.]
MNLFTRNYRISDTFFLEADFMLKLAHIIKLSPEERMNIYEELSEYLECGVSITQAVMSIRDSYLKESKMCIAAVTLNDVASKLSNGTPPSKALSQYIPSTEVIAIRSGDIAGQLGSTLNRLSITIDKTRTLKRQAILGALMPVTGLIISIGSIYFMGLEVIPKFEDVMPPEHWTGVPWTLYITSQYVQSPWSILPVATIALLLIAIAVTMKSWTGKLRVYADLLPPWSFYRIINGGNWLVSLALMTKSGANTLQSIQQMEALADPWLRERLVLVRYHMENGVSFGKSLDIAGHNFPDKKIVRKLSLLSELPHFDENLEKAGNRFIEQGDKMIKNQSLMLNSFIFAIVALMAFWFVIGIVDLQVQVGDFFRGKSNI